MNSLNINNRSDRELLEAATEMARAFYVCGWRLHRVQFADLERIEYQHVFTDHTFMGEEWDPVEDPFDIVFFYIDIYRADGTETHYIRNESGWELLEDKYLPYAPEAEE